MAHRNDAELDGFELNRPERSLPTWDSVTQVQVILAVEEAIGTDLTVGEALALTSVRAIVETLRKHGVALEAPTRA